MITRRPLILLLAALVLGAVTACSRAPEPKQYELKGQILAVRPESKEVVVRHEDIKGFMPAMTMPYSVQDPALLEGKAPGDLITATLLVGETTAHRFHRVLLFRRPLRATEVACAHDMCTALREPLDRGEGGPDAEIIGDRHGEGLVHRIAIGPHQARAHRDRIGERSAAGHAAMNMPLIDDMAVGHDGSSEGDIGSDIEG